MIIDKILNWIGEGEKTLDDSARYEFEKLAGYSFRRQFLDPKKDENDNKLRMSELGKCGRALAYKHLGYPKKGKEIDNRGRITFFAGDIYEAAIVTLAKRAGVKITATGLNQITCSLTIADQEIIGHPDGMIFDEAKGWGLIEIKSMSSFAFDRFSKTGEIDGTYQTQIQLYMHALKLAYCVFVAVNKDNGVLHEKVILADTELANKAMEKISNIIKFNNANDMEGEYKPNEKGKLPWQCAYCSFWGHCWPGAEYKFKGRSNDLILPLSKDITEKTDIKKA